MSVTWDWLEWPAGLSVADHGPAMTSLRAPVGTYPPNEPCQAPAPPGA